MSIELFFYPFLFSIYFHPVDPCVIGIISGGCNQSSSAFFYVVFEYFINASTLSSMLESPLPPSFQDTYSQSTSSLGCNALCVVISFLVLWSTCLSSSLIHFKNCPEYLMRGTAQVFIPFIRYLLHSLVPSSFLVLLRYSFLILSFISTYLMVSAANIPKYL